jgi:pimeloyl-ACP methyl ester carboxylesterase
MIWGKKDPVCVTAVGEHIWDNYLKNRKSAPAEIEWIDEANHYIQVDHAKEVAQIVKNVLSKK